ncbi:MAG: hypothetical protein NTU47_00745 [Ignavibacteriales bacterium]|nr:hypothetical protein [Ignavibacteriales bacterium]
MMKLRKAFGAAWFIVTTVVTSNAYGQVGFESHISTMYDDNILNNYQQISDKVSTLTLNTGYGFGGIHWDARVFYDGTLNYYQSVTDRTNQFHSLQTSFALYSGEDQENVLNVGVSYGQGFYRGSSAFYNHDQVTAIVQYKQFLSDLIINNLGYAFRSIRFSDMSDFSYSEHALSGGFSFALPTQTTLIVQADLGAKFYSTPSSTGEAEGMRKGGMSFAPGVIQFGPLIRIGQSIFEGTGLSLTTKYQWNIQKQARYISTSYGSVSDDELFDDHYGHEGLHTSLMLTQLLPESMVMKVTGGVQNRLYSSLAAYDLDGNVLSSQRTDLRTSLSVLLQKDFQMGFTLKAAVDFIRNYSNDPYYNYRNSALALELSLPF